MVVVLFSEGTTTLLSRLPRFLCSVLVLFCLALLTTQAHATYRADFFDTTKRPVVTFDKGKMTWTLRNQGVERVVRYDAKTGGLQTLALRDLKTHHVLRQASGGEGEISFAAPMLQTPVPVDDWKYTLVDPDSRWVQPEFDAGNWKAVPHLSSGEVQSGTYARGVWYRAAVPAKQLQPGHAYALYLRSGWNGEGEIYADGKLIQKLPAATVTANTQQIDLPVECRVIAIHVKGYAPLPAYIVEVGTSPPDLLLTGNWLYMHHTINIGEDNSQILTIRLAGLKQYEGFDLDVCYQIYAGEEPTLAKWFSFVQHRKSHFLIEMATCDRWLLPESWAKSEAHSKPGVPFIQADARTGDVLLTTTLGESRIESNTEDSTGATIIAPITALNLALRPELPQRTPRSLTAFWHGDEGTAQFLHQLYVGQYVTRGNPTAIPITYNTRFPYHDLIDAATCRQIIPLAAQLGVQGFVLDDGWETNHTPDTGRYGDWLTDKNKFPEGLTPISLLVRANKMRFGLWTEAARVNPSSEATLLHPEWLYKSVPTGSESDDTPDRMCFTGAWARQFTQSMRSLCREQDVTYLKTAFHAADGCVSTAHEHPVGHSLNAEQDAWALFCDTLREANKTLVVLSDGGEGEAEDALLEADWIGPAFNTGPLTSWSRLVNRQIPATEYILPTFMHSGQALCHLATISPASRDYLEYLWSRAAAQNVSFEVQGELRQMSGEEREVGRKWIDWNLQNREWLAFSQPITFRTRASGSVPDGTECPAVRGVLHLRNALNGRYGYLCFWNRDDAEVAVKTAFTPSDYFVRMKSNVQIVNTADGKSVPFAAHEGTISLDKIMLPAYGWAVYEIKAK